jgi:hypothetical protein
MKLLALAVFATTCFAQVDLSGSWAPSRATGAGAPPPPTPIVMKPSHKAAYEALQTKIREATARSEQYAIRALCSPYGMPNMMAIASYPTEILQSPTQITLIAEAFSEVRRVYIDKPQLPVDDVPPTYTGRSVGHWEKDTLVVETVGIKESVPGYQNLLHSDQMRITERFRRPTPDTLHDQITIEDSVTLEKPVTYTLVYRRMPDYEMVEFVCDNNREYIDENNIVRMRMKDK